jgi:hypothetical protein
MNFETNFEFNDQEFCLKVSNDEKVVRISIACVGTPMLWGTQINLNDLVKNFDFLEGCFFKPLDLAEYLEYQINNQEFRLESADEESKILHLIFWVQKEKEEEIEQYEFYFSLMSTDSEYEEILIPKANEINNANENKDVLIGNLF